MFDFKKAVLKDNIFRGYDIRAKIPEELNDEGVYALGRAYGTFLSRRRINESVLTHDNRLTSESIKKIFIQGLVDSGINVLDGGLGLVFFMYFGQYLFQSKGGVNISASHNPKEYNGFKLAVGFSDTMVTEEVEELRVIAQKGDFVTPKSSGTVKKVDIFESYKRDLYKRMPESLDFKVVIDGGNCTPGKFLPDILRGAGCTVIEQNTELDGNFPLGTPDPTEKEYLQRLAEGVVREKADIGFCYDPDGDRIGIVDEKGNYIWNDVLVSIFAKDVLESVPHSKIIFNTLCSKQVIDVIEECGGRPVMWLTGHSFIKAKLREERGLFGGELSGHFFFMDNFYGHDDCAYASLRLLNYLKKYGSLSQVVSQLPKYFSSPEIKLGLSDSIKFGFVKDVLGNELKKLYSDAKYIEIDGVRFDTPTKMAIIRASQNGPYVTIKFEGKTQKEYEELKKELGKILKSHSEIDWKSGVNIDAFN